MVVSFLQVRVSSVVELEGAESITGIPRLTLLMWGHTHKKMQEQKPRKSRLLSSTKGEENTVEL